MVIEVFPHMLINGCQMLRTMFGSEQGLYKSLLNERERGDLTEF